MLTHMYPQSNIIMYYCLMESSHGEFLYTVTKFWGPWITQWLRHCATSRVVPGSNPGGVGHRDFSRGYRQNHVPWGQLSL